VPDVELDMKTDPDQPDPQRQAWSGEVGSLIEVALDSLPDRDRAVLVMREIQGMPYADIAQTLELPLGTLKARLHRAREQLRARLIQAGVTP
jgi:RNA polymerase sigma-70 factor (ECF subfamily)